MKKNDKSDTFLNLDLYSLIEEIQAGDKQAEKKLEILILPIIRNWENALSELNLENQDAIQEIKFRLIKQLRKGPQKIDDPKAYISKVARSFLFGAHEETLAKKRGGSEKEVETGRKKRVPIRLDSLEAREEKARETDQSPRLEGERAFGKNDAGPEELAERRESRGANVIRDSYMNLPEDLRAGIEKSLDLIVQLFQMRGRLRKDLRHSLRIFKAMDTIKKTERLIAKNEKLIPQSKDLQRFLILRDHTPVLLGTPEGEKAEDERRAEIDKIKDKFGENELSVALLLDEAQTLLDLNVVDSLSLDLTSGYLLHDYAGTWEDHLPEIARMKVSPPSIIYKVWSKAPGFSTGRLRKYRSRERIAVAFRYHKLVSKGTQREFLFQSIGDVREIKDPEILITILERFRKAGYGQALQKKYRPIVNLIFRESFGKK